MGLSYFHWVRAVQGGWAPGGSSTSSEPWILCVLSCFSVLQGSYGWEPRQSCWQFPSLWYLRELLQSPLLGPDSTTKYYTFELHICTGFCECRRIISLSVLFNPCEPGEQVLCLLCTWGDWSSEKKSGRAGSPSGPSDTAPSVVWEDWGRPVHSCTASSTCLIAGSGRFMPSTSQFCPDQCMLMPAKYSALQNCEHFVIWTFVTVTIII